MIEKTFLFLPGVGEKTEKNLWKRGVKDWNTFLQKDSVKGLGKGKKLMADKQLLEAKKALVEDDEKFFSLHFPNVEHWRLYERFRDDAVFLDIETSGGYGYITVIGLYDGYDVKHMVKGANLYREALEEELKKYKLIVTFNGRSFDVPVINKYFNEVVPDIPHLDLRHACAKLGLKGGLKLIEQELDIERETIVHGLSGGDAVTLWDRFRITQDDKYLKKLLAYNAEDIINLKPLAEHVYKELENEMFQELA